jgi:hypothetical protein
MNHPNQGPRTDVAPAPRTARHAGADRNHADAIVRAMLFPDLQQRADQAYRRQRAAQLERHQRRVAWLTLAGVALGALSAHALGQRFAVGALWGGVTGQLIGPWFKSRLPA